jgi:uncharacterized protein (TIGR00725 family)
MTPIDAMANQTVTIFGSAFPSEGSEDYRTAYELGRLLGREGFVVCNGGYFGTMEASARGAKDGGTTTVGVVTEYFSREANGFIDRKIVEKTLIERLQRLIELGDGYAILRGGTGTLVELATVWEFRNKGLLTAKPIVVIGNFWQAVIDTMRGQLGNEGRSEARNAVVTADSPEECVAIMKKALRP